MYSALGNHDYHPKSQLPGASNNIYNKIAEMWKGWLDPESQRTFKQGGHFLNIKKFNTYLFDCVNYFLTLCAHRRILYREAAESNRSQGACAKH